MNPLKPSGQKHVCSRQTISYDARFHQKRRGRKWSSMFRQQKWRFGDMIHFFQFGCIWKWGIPPSLRGKMMINYIYDDKPRSHQIWEKPYVQRNREVNLASSSQIPGTKKNGHQFLCDSNSRHPQTPRDSAGSKQPPAFKRFHKFTGA